jgi:transcriptional regulator with PAS, ATPase and Fis domain
VAASPGLAPEAFPVLALGRALQLGRDAELSLPDPMLSRVHCALVEVGRSERHLVRDLSSRNGTFVNGQRVSEHRLAPGDLLRVGDSVLVYTSQPSPDAPELPPPLLGESSAMREIAGVVRKLAAADLAVLIQGETGSGKELVARALHDLSRPAGPFVAVNAGAVPSGLFESEVFGYVRGAFTGAVSESKGLFASADEGTLFLDEVSELSFELQVKLLRVIEHRSVRPLGSTREISVDVRVIAATNLSLREAVDRGKFRGDLFARLGEASFVLPPLRQRREDIMPLARHFLRECRGDDVKTGFTANFAEALLLYSWPFNVRELRSLMRRLVALHGERALWDLGLLPEEMQEPVRGRGEGGTEVRNDLETISGSTAPSEPELRKLLEEHSGNVKRIAQVLGKDRAQIYRWLQRYGLRSEVFRPRR